LGISLAGNDFYDKKSGSFILAGVLLALTIGLSSTIGLFSTIG
jgi:hypothetical protein